MIKRLLVLALFPCLLLGNAACASAPSGSEITVLKVGKADAILLQSAGHTILIDAGEEEDAREILSFLQKRHIEALDALIVTHFDKDHVGGADGVLGGIPVARAFDPAYETDAKQYREYTQALETAGVSRVRVAQPLTLTFGALTLTLLPAPTPAEGDNDNSLIISADDGLHTFLFAADAEEARIAALLTQGVGAHDVLKMPHHGRMKENLDALLDVIEPEIAVITDSDKNPADEKTLFLLDDFCVDVYQTRHGDITILSGQGGLTVIQ